MAMTRPDLSDEGDEEMPDAVSVQMVRKEYSDRAPESSGNSEPTPGPSNIDSRGSTKTNVPKWFKQPFK